MNKLLEATLENLKEHLGTEYHSGQDYGYYRGTSGENPDSEVARLRLDWELADGTLDDPDDVDKVKDLMMDYIGKDLQELIDDGDAQNYSDAFLSVMDGSKKRGKEPVVIDIFSAKLWKEYKEKKKVTEFTLYILMYVEWA